MSVNSLESDKYYWGYTVCYWLYSKCYRDYRDYSKCCWDCSKCYCNWPEWIDVTDCHTREVEACSAQGDRWVGVKLKR